MLGEILLEIKMVEPENALLRNIAVKGEASYYYAHAPRKVEIPEEAKVLEGVGIVTGGPPILIGRQEPKAPLNPVVVNIRNYSWRDAGAKIIVYIPLIREIVSDRVRVEFGTQSLDLSIVYDDELTHNLKLQKLMHPILPEESTWQVRTNKLVLKIAKTEEKTKWHVIVGSP
mmetsp:Transcript_28978/g.51816  ORF Transcript_28978/g.51816 Transcript_28978/m.51816 type:complete len:172 (-) Transcript_28978:139-654(-)|eukprot:CAMPEP_0204913040 /NCGR_PEP_ID=MMETSP1397-20131031/11080_1 /ASSEMBLY_ACC=CAM_ASM_000891 /TAXON_ID=49980 /ORGANISM="Climacostomum Climacostomum virens, Strain Stock W-24" /LENGTH=171 /DNA_ID=CAMNT_0052084221 /DNA_START=566 /DNA_END=1084 /DNA_ORIENTATION=+